MIPEITPDLNQNQNRIRVSINADSQSLVRQLSGTVSNTLQSMNSNIQSMVMPPKDIEFAAATTDINISQRQDRESVSQQIIKDQIIKSKYEETIYNELKDIKKEKDMLEYIDNLKFKLKRISEVGTMQFVFATMWFVIGLIYLIRRIWLLAVDFQGEAIQFSYRKNTFKPMSFEIVPFLILWLFAIFSSMK